MIFADTGWFIALVNPSDALHDRAVRWLSRFPEPIITTEYVLLETFNALSAITIRRRAHEVLHQVLPEIETVRNDRKLFDEGLTLHRERVDKTWSLTDCISFVLMRRLGLHQALAYDHHFEQAGFDALLRRDPS